MTREDYYWLNEESIDFLKKDYVSEGQEPIDRFNEIADHAEKLLGIPGYAEKFKRYTARGFYSFSSPVMSNFGNDKGLPCSCNGSYIEDSIESILTKVAEVGTMTKYGAGTSAYFGEIRPRGSLISSDKGKSTGSVHFAQLFDKDITVISQGAIRRGSFAGYWPITHGDIEEVLRIRDDGNDIQHISFGVTIPNEWMRAMIAGDSEKRRIWALVLQSRSEKGYPYLFFSDNVNEQKPQVYKDLDMTIWASNLCTEIMLPSSPIYSFVCNIGSLNLEQWDEMSKTDAVETYLFFLDAVTQEYINKTEGIKFMEPAHAFARDHRAVGVGALGWHSYLQSKMIAFESLEAKALNFKIFKEIKARLDKANAELAEIFGEPLLLQGRGLRMTTTMAIAPNTSSSFYLGQVSPGIEPENSNYYVKDLAKGKYTKKNPWLKKVLEEYRRDDLSTWNSILQHGGSVQHLDFMSQKDRDVFKTFDEISQKELIIQAITRQKFIDQGQSLNLSIPLGTPVKDINQLIIYAWENGIKSLYYQRGANPAQKLSRSILECKSCEG